MRTASLISITYVLIHTVLSDDYEETDDTYVYRPQLSSCTGEQETFNLTEIGEPIKFSGTAICRQYEQLFLFYPDPNATKGRVLNFLEISGIHSISFNITEFTTHPNGSIDEEVLRSHGEFVGKKTLFAPTTGISIRFKRDSGGDYTEYTFTATLAETALNESCPYPFLDLQPYAPVALEEAMIKYACDVLVIAPQGYEIRIDHIKDNDASHITHIRVREGTEILERFSTFPVDETIPGTGRATIDFWLVSDNSHKIEMQISAVKLNCTCGPSSMVFNLSQDLLFFETPEYPKRHCRMVSCQTTFTLPPNLRSSYKMQLAPFAIFLYGAIEIEDGPNGIKTTNDRLVRSFTFESPSVTVKYTPGRGRNGGVFSLEMALVQRKEGCVCPHQANIATNFFVEIPNYCSNVDCLYLLPKADDNTIQYTIDRDQNDYLGCRRESSPSDVISFVATKTGRLTYSGSEGLLLRFHRGSRPTIRSMIFNATYTTSGVHISHAERCGCFNKTILLEPDQALAMTSPDWPAHYCDNLVCVNTYVAPAHHHLEVKLGTILLEPERDRLQLFEGTSITGSEIKVITGEISLSDSISSSSTVLTAVFTSNGAVAYDGFNGTIRTVMDKTWADHLKHHISSWWWLFGILLIVSVGGLIVLKRRGILRRSRSINLMDF